MNDRNGKVCRSCAYSCKSAISLTCRRYPPTALVETRKVRHGYDTYEDQIITSQFVEVNDEDWCGEYRDKQSK